MQQFDVLNRNLCLHQHYLLEASAGTGKTFSIQNIVVRLLIEPKNSESPLLLNQILVVTFTRAAARDLKVRIRANIDRALACLNGWLLHQEMKDGTPDYLKAIIETGAETARKAKKRLQHALFTFDQAQIFTIHSFCARMLKQYAMESDLGFHALGGEDPMPKSEILAILRDFFRTEIDSDQYSRNQIEKFLNPKEQHSLLKVIQNNDLIAEFPSFKELYDQFNASMHKLKQTFSLTSLQLIEDFNAQVPFFKNYKSEKSKADTLTKAIRFAALFDKTEWSLMDFEHLVRDHLVWTKALDPALIKKKALENLQLNFPGFTEALRQELDPLINRVNDEAIALARLAKNFKDFLKHYQSEEEKLSPDDFLLKMDAALTQPNFLKCVQNLFQAAIIDEFQDTDPLQWRIFQSLFLPLDERWNGRLYLVGDPKQSIYSFRQADIYTYLSAAERLGSAHRFSLDVNYRSHPHLVEALNLLFDSRHIPTLIPLPKNQSCLPYRPVKSTSLSMPLNEDGRGAVHFFIGDASGMDKAKIEDLEKRVYFPFIIQEIIHLHQTSNVGFGQFAILVRDRHQAKRLAVDLKSACIPCVHQRKTSLADSSALSALIELLRAILHPGDRSAVKGALGSQLLGWSYDEIRALDSLEKVLLIIQHLNQSLHKEGFSIFFRNLLKSRWQGDRGTVQELLLSREDGIEFYHDLQQLVDLIIEHQYSEWNTPGGIIPFLDELKNWDADDARLLRLQDQSKEGVRILTLHYSKGLEFEVVFALGLINRKNANEKLIPIEKEGGRVLIPASEDAEAYVRYCEENDAEKMRQLYVALTRAKYRLYIPAALSLPSDSLQIGEASPMDLYTARLSQTRGEYEELYGRIRTNQNQPLVEFIEQLGEQSLITYSIDSLLSFEKFQSRHEPFTLNPPEAIAIHHPSLFVTSFSGISQQFLEAASPVIDKTMPHDYNHPAKTVHTLPANADTGVLVHALLEKVNYPDFRNLPHESQALSLIQPMIQKTEYSEWGDVLASLIWRALKVKLEPESFCLADLEPDQLYREMPFLFAFDKELAIEGVESSHGLIKGVIDLVFTHQGRYYIVDWKTNWLGDELESYREEKLHRAMSEHAYFLQAKIYQEALKRYLNVMERRPFEECFGGVYYLFLRGLSLDSPTGVYHMSSQRGVVSGAE